MNYTKDELMARGEYLVNVIDKLPDKATYQDIDNLPKGNHVVTYGPSSGKTTAIRQFIVEHFKDPNYVGVVATKLIDDVESLHYDILAHLIYLYPKTSIDSLKSVIRIFTSSDSEVTYQSLQSAEWIICTHERLLIESPSLLYIRDINSIVTKVPTYRSYLFIDEYPSDVYKRFSIDSLMSPLLLNNYACPGIDPASPTADVMRSEFISNAYHNGSNDLMVSTILDKLPTPTSQSFTLDTKRGSDSRSSVFSRERLIFFANILNKKYSDLVKSGRDLLKTEYVYYSINDMLFDNKYIFDGTGDLILRNSTTWNNLDDPRFSRKLYLNHPVRSVLTYVTRNDSTEVIGTEYVESISQIANKHPDSRIIVYTWKDSKSDLELLDQYIMHHLDKSIANRVNMIHYMSGQERVTSKYSDSDVVVILGKFYIPRSEVKLMNDINDSKTTLDDYTLSLIIQLIYRSSARKSKPITLYVTNDYSNAFVSKLLDSYESVTIENTEDSVLDRFISPRVTVSRIPELLNKIMNWKNLIHKEDSYLIIKSCDLAECLGINYKWKSSDLKKRLSRNNISYEVTTTSGGNGNYCLFTIMIPTELDD